MLRWIIPLLALIALMLIPMSTGTGNLVRVRLIKTHDSVILFSNQGSVEVKVDGQAIPSAVRSSSNPYDFFSGLGFESERFEILPYPNGMVCQAVKADGQKITGPVETCLALALRSDTPVFVHPSLLQKSAPEAPKSL